MGTDASNRLKRLTVRSVVSGKAEGEQMFSALPLTTDMIDHANMSVWCLTGLD
jgi:hypothetical protein